MINQSRIIPVSHIGDEDALRAFVQACDADLERRMNDVAQEIASEKDLKLIGLTGPTCAGKTTAARKLTQTLEAYGKRVHVISVDDFFYEKSYLEQRAKEDPDIEIDYDSEETIDVELLKEKTLSLLSCKKTKLPLFNFHSGMRQEGQVLQPQSQDVFLFEGIQILYPKVNEILNQGNYRSIYICPMSSIQIGDEIFDPNEIRLMRRLVRDSIYRSAKADFTLYLWQSVRANEEKHIFPNVHKCDSCIDSTMAYEIGMLKPYLKGLLEGYPEENPFFEDAMTVLEQLKGVEEIPSAYILPNSLYHEFV